MADYVTTANVKTLIDRVLSVYKTNGAVSDTHLELIIDASEGMVNAAIASRYDIPVTASEGIKYLRALVIPIIRYKTFTQFADQEDFPEGIKEEYKATLKQLEMLAKRVTSLPGVDDKTTGRASHIKISQSTSPIANY